MALFMVGSGVPWPLSLIQTEVPQAGFFFLLIAEKSQRIFTVTMSAQKCLLLILDLAHVRRF